ncbi:hypothetical protein LTR42_010399 [Elasticomyces elasticus]|nr:hypothetical protein LTR42_010399 [Elasticomyces elasticus]
MAVTSDLFAAIAALSRIYLGAWFWLDAVSIDQANLAEKSVQVADMGSTYKQAEKTVVWLGQEFADDTASSNHPPGVPSICGLTVASPKNLVRRADRVWWKRTWIVQEMVLAQTLEVVVGARAISWADFASSAVTVYDMAREDMSVLEGVAKIAGLGHLRDSFPRWSTSSSHLTFLLFFTAHTRCKDPRDKIYAMLGLATDVDRCIRVDYTLSTAQVFTSVARHLIAMYPEDILQWGGIGTQRAGLAYDPKDQTSLPSSVPDYSGEMGTGYIQGPQIRYSNYDDHDQNSAGGSSDGRHLRAKYNLSSMPVLQFWVDNAPSMVAINDVQPHELHVEGLVFDYVDEIFYTREGDRASGQSGIVMDLDELCRHIPPILRRDLPPSDPRHHIDRSAAFWNTVLLQLYRPRPAEGYRNQSNGPRPWAVREFLAAPPSDPLRSEEDSKKPAVHLAEVYREFELTMRGVPLFTTALGFFGLGPTFMRPGDCVAVLFGGQTPFVLRPTGKPGEYTFVGHCYVHGIMNGELIKLLDQGLLESEWFVLV